MLEYKNLVWIFKNRKILQYGESVITDKVIWYIYGVPLKVAS